MDPITHALLTRLLVSRRPAIYLVAANWPDLPFYLVYPIQAIKPGVLRRALQTQEWPEPPLWLPPLHYALHSFPVALTAGLLERVLTSRWPRAFWGAWLLHIVVDLPTHTRRAWGPRFLWPFSDFAVDGIAWTDGLIWLLRLITGKPRQLTGS